MKSLETSTSSAAGSEELLFQAPSVSVPKGGGAISGIGETFTANPVTGTGRIAIPIAVSPARGLTPSLSLSYDSGSGNGPFGLGWQLSASSIRRKTERGLPGYQDSNRSGHVESDTFVLPGGEDLVPMRTQDPTTGAWSDVIRKVDGYCIRSYRPRVEGAFSRIERWTQLETGDVHWRVRTGGNVLQIFGQSPEACVTDPDDPRRTFEWLLEEVQDEVGDIVCYAYKREDRTGVLRNTPAETSRNREGNRCTWTYLKRITYGNRTPFSAGDWCFEIVLDYGEHDEAIPTPEEVARWRVRRDPFSTFRAGFDRRCYRLCRRILVFHHFDELGLGPTLVRSTELNYQEQPAITLLSSATQRGWKRLDDAYETQSLPPVEFAYTQPTIDTTPRFVEGIEDLPRNFDISRFQMVDLDGEGLSGLLTEWGGSWYYKRNEGQGRLGRLKKLQQRPEASLGGMRLMDLGGAGHLDVVQHQVGVQSGFYRRSADAQGWESFRSFRRIPSRDLDDPNLRLIDLTGDGRTDLLVSEDSVFLWHPSEGDEGFGTAFRVFKSSRDEEGPRMVFAGEAESIFLADMTGDGLTDLVRVRNGVISYWPNRGYGRFGAKIAMSQAPWFDAPNRFDPRRVRLADVDGTGTTDLLYIGPDGVRLWFNQAGNGYGAEQRLTGFLHVSSAATVQVADLRGDGTACLVWSSSLLSDRVAPLRYMHLMAEGKPYLLSRVTNNLGREMRLEYTPSTVFYAADRRADAPGQPACPSQCTVYRGWFSGITSPAGS